MVANTTEENEIGDTEPLGHDELWRDVLAGTHPSIRVGRRLFRRLPGEPRCKLCAAPLGGAASPLMRLIGKGAWPKNPKYCGSCFGLLSEHHGGAEIEKTVHALRQTVRALKAEKEVKAA